jgi:hypothetical protein
MLVIPNISIGKLKSRELLVAILGIENPRQPGYPGVTANLGTAQNEGAPPCTASPNGE